MTCFFSKKKWAKKHTFFMVHKTKQTLLYENYERFSKEEKKYQQLIFVEVTYLGSQWVQVQTLQAWF